MNRATRSAFPFLAAVAAIAAAPGASQGGPRAEVAPGIVAFSPAAVHAGDEFLIDADFAGRSPPRVWVGAYRVPRSRLRLDAQGGASGTRRIWGRVPKRVPAGAQILKIATRAGAAAFAKPIQVASCSEAPFDCGDIPDSGADLAVTGAGGYSVRIQLATSPSVMPEPFEPDVVGLNFCGDAEGFRCLSIHMTEQDAAELHVGTVTALELSYYDGLTGNVWVRNPGGSIRVLEAEPHRVGLCVDSVLTFVGALPDSLPATLTVRGYVVIAR